MGRFWLLLFFCWPLISSFFWSTDEERDLRTLHQLAEVALKEEDFGKAKNCYRELIDRIGVNSVQKYPVNWPTYIDIVLRFAEACEKIGAVSEGEKALSHLLLQNPPTDQIPCIKLLQARLKASHRAPGEAYIEMREIVECFPKDQLRKEELSFFHALEYSLNTHYDQMGSRAKRYFVSKFYSEAAALYEEILLAIQTGHYAKARAENSLIEKKIRYQLAECHYRQAQDAQSFALCYGEETNEDRIDREWLHLSALCYREKKEYEKALSLLEHSLSLGKREDLDHYDHALFEIGHFYYEVGNKESARLYFERLQHSGGKPKIVAALYLARLALQEGEAHKVEELLAPLSKKLTSTDLLLYECYYLRATAAYTLGVYTKALDLFERSLPSKSCDWSQEALFHLGWCYLHLGEKRRNLSLFSKAEAIFHKLYASKQEECVALALGHLNQLRWTHFHDKTAFDKLEPLLLPLDSIEALLIRAAAFTTFAKREELLEKATTERFCSSPLYVAAWCERGLNYFQEGLIEKAAWAFNHSVRAMGQKNIRSQTLSLLETLLKKFDENVEECEETLYLRGLIASHLQKPLYHSIAEDSLYCVAHGEGKYREQALYILGILYYRHHAFEKALETLTRLAASAPRFSLASEAWFWAAEAAEKSGKEEIAAACRLNLYYHYPQSSKAAEAYFRQYAHETYLAGEKGAITHLKGFPQLFPHSPLLVAAYYLIGINEESQEGAKEAFEESIKAFSFCLNEERIPDSSFIYFRYQACLKLAKLYLSSDQNLEIALHLLHSLVKDFETPDHPLTSQLRDKTLYPSLYEEGEYNLVQAYLKTGKRLRAQERLAKMLKHYQEAGINEGFYLSQVWREQGKLAHECQDDEVALSCFEIAEEVCSKDLDFANTF